VAGIRLTKAEREALVHVADTVLLYEHDFTTGKHDQKMLKGWRSLVEKVKAADAPKDKGCSLSLKIALSAFDEVLGKRLVRPPPGAQAVWAQLTNRLKALGLTRDDCITVAKAAAGEWRGPIKAYSLLNQADTLLAMASGNLDTTVRGTAPLTRADLDEL
jgi:hypothetical protein